MYVIYKLPIVLNIWFEHFLSHKYTTVIKNWYIFWTAQFPQRLSLWRSAEEQDVQCSSFHIHVLNVPVFKIYYFSVSPTGAGSAVPGWEDLEPPEHSECMGGHLWPGSVSLGQAPGVVSLELYPADQGRGRRPRQTCRPGGGTWGL